MLASDSEPSLPSQASEVNQELLLSKGVILPGLKDQRGLGLTVLVDARRYPPVSVLFMAFTEIQTLFPNILYSILMLVDKEAAFKPERDSIIQYEVLTTLKALHKHIDLNQLTQEFEGTFPYDHSQWIQFRRFLGPATLRIPNISGEKPVIKNCSKVQHIMDEMISTEREYVRSLGYIIENYFPEMERMDLPQDLRGKRNIIFGNLEKLYDFHSQYFLKDLEHCVDCPLFVSSCFLRHEEQFGMYALYSKNKPQSDTLLASHGNGFFKNKQLELGDKLDLASYLLKPIQRMSKYALLLKDMIKDCSKSQEQELSDLRAAEEMVKFQLRHGNDLLAMDAIRGCDVNLKEQGQLRCQDEFIVWCGRRKNLRHVFLFEDLILFSKTKKIDGGYDVYIYKQSYKTAEIGMTENVGDSGLRFEIWFRRRKSQDTFILQASAELRMQEMVSMGIGNKPFMDIKPSAAAISDRAVDYIMKGTESRTRASIAVSSFDHSTPFKRPHSTISSSSTSSSSSQSSSSILGSLNLHTYPSPTFNHWSYDIGTCIEEDELEQETGSQPSMNMAYLANSLHAEYLQRLDLSGHDVADLFPSTFFKLLSRASRTLKSLTLEECNIGDNHVNMMILGLVPCRKLSEFKFLGNPLGSQALKGLFSVFVDFPHLKYIEFPVSRDCYPDNITYPLDDACLVNYDNSKFQRLREELLSILHQANRDDIVARTPLFGSYDAEIQETRNELGVFMLQSFRDALSSFVDSGAK
ncbi:UNVERIFIED_CONTAM: hypothetical protein FKN15_012075 [Acipenser sinensis]